MEIILMIFGGTIILVLFAILVTIWDIATSPAIVDLLAWINKKTQWRKRRLF